MTAGLCAALFFVIYFWNSRSKEKVTLVGKIAFISIIVAFTWLYISVSTSGLIDKRYANQDASGREKQDLTTGRGELIDAELQAFYNNPLTGIGIGKMKEFRLETTGRDSATHNEVTRTLSEHGTFGLMALVVLIIAPLVFRIRNKTNLYMYSFFLFWFLTINHSSMRIAAPAFIYGLCLITIIDANKRPVIYRK